MRFILTAPLGQRAEAVKSSSGTKNDNDDVGYHMAVLGTPKRKHLLHYLLQTLLNIYVKEARPTTLRLAWDAHNESTLPSYIKNLSPQLHIHTLEDDIPDPPSNRPGISNFYSALLVPEEIGMATLPLLLVEEDVVLLDDFHLYLARVLQLVESKMSHLHHRKYLVTLYIGIDWKQIGPVGQVLKVRQKNGGNKSRISSVEDLMIDKCFDPHLWQYGTQGVLVSAELRSPLRTFLKPYALGELIADFNIDQLLTNFLGSNKDTSLCFCTSPSLVEHIGVYSSLFGDNHRFHMSKDFPREVSIL